MCGVITVMIVIILMAALLIVIALGVYSSGIMVQIKGHTLEEARERQSNHYDTGFYDRLEKVDYEVASYDGYLLHAQLLKHPEPSQKYVILSHGYTDNRFGCLKYVRLYLELGFNCVIYDLRGHGLNEKTFCTYSIREGRDLCAVVGDARKRWPEMACLGLHGESLGAATTAAAMRYKPQVDFAVADCGFSEINSILKAGMRMSHLPGFMFGVARLCAKIRYGFDFNDMRPVDALRENDVPMLFIHGEADAFIPSSHSVAMRDATRGDAELFLVPAARHARSVFIDYDGYLQRLDAFIKSHKGN